MEYTLYIFNKHQPCWWHTSLKSHFFTMCGYLSKVKKEGCANTGLGQTEASYRKYKYKRMSYDSYMIMYNSLTEHMLLLPQTCDSQIYSSLSLWVTQKSCNALQLIHQVTRLQISCMLIHDLRTSPVRPRTLITARIPTSIVITQVINL